MHHTSVIFLHKLSTTVYLNYAEYTCIRSTCQNVCISEKHMLSGNDSINSKTRYNRWRWLVTVQTITCTPEVKLEISSFCDKTFPWHFYHPVDFLTFPSQLANSLASTAISGFPDMRLLSSEADSERDDKWKTTKVIKYSDWYKQSPPAVVYGRDGSRLIRWYAKLPTGQLADTKSTCWRVKLPTMVNSVTMKSNHWIHNCRNLCHSVYRPSLSIHWLHFQWLNL